MWADTRATALDCLCGLKFDDLVGRIKGRLNPPAPTIAGELQWRQFELKRLPIGVKGSALHFHSSQVCAVAIVLDHMRNSPTSPSGSRRELYAWMRRKER